jgi:steroid delta-isomerase-like uncharacterized protein
MSLPEHNTRIIRRWLNELWNENRVNVADEIFAADYVRHEGEAPVRGPDGIRRLRALYASAFPDLRFREDDLLADGDRVAVRWTATGTHMGTFLGVPATGRRGTASGSDFFRLIDGRIVESWPCFDYLVLLKQLGAPPITPR